MAGQGLGGHQRVGGADAEIVPEIGGRDALVSTECRRRRVEGTTCGEPFLVATCSNVVRKASVLSMLAG